MSRNYELKTPFWIDTDGYTDRDREMFVCGVEFQMICQQLDSGEPFERPIHSENASRVRMLCGRRGRKCEIKDTTLAEWKQLTVDPD